jgi:glycine betaine/proline transport system permease protein
VALASAAPAARRPPPLIHFVWILPAALAFLIYVFRDSLPWAAAYPAEWRIPIAAWIGAFMNWVIATFFDVTRAVSRLLELPLDLAFGLLRKGFEIGPRGHALVIPPLSWIGVTASVAIAGYVYGGRRLALGTGLCFLYLAVFGQWDSAMLTLALILIAMPLGVLIGLLIGIWGYRQPEINRWLILPMLDIGQATPQFAYLVPMLMLFGNNPSSALLATLAFAVPPMVRATVLALQQVPSEIQEFGRMAGCTRGQHLWRILIPSARPLLMVGVNQVVMMTLNMVIIASMIGAGGLGYDVLLALRSLKVGTAFEAGIAIVLLAIVLDRLSQAMATWKPGLYRPEQGFARRHPYLLLAIAILLGTTLIGMFIPVVSRLPDSLTITTAPVWDASIKWITIHYFDNIEALRVWLLLHLLNPLKAFLLSLPWPCVILLLGASGLRLGGWRLGLLVLALSLLIAAVGLWEKTIITVYLCGFSTAVACLIGMPIGVLASRNDTAERIIAMIIDTLQTIPAFVYLIPAVMLFRVGDVAAMIGIVLYSLTPAIRYTDHGIRKVNPGLIEAAKVSGCTRRQILWRVQLPLALPEIMLGLNQVIMLALSMDIIAAMIGTRDLGQEVFVALAKADPGRGIVAGLAVAFIGIVADRLISAWSARVRERFGLSAA